MPLTHLVEGQESIPVTAYSSAGGWQFRCASSPEVQFFELMLSFVGAVEIEAPWAARETIVAYAPAPILFRPFGPDDEPIHLPAGYSFLRRSCGSSAKPWIVHPVDASEPVTFLPSILPNFFPRPRPPETTLREQNETLLLATCGVQPRALELGRRLNFDRATTVQFSADGTEVHYLVGIDPADPNRTASLRSADVTTGVARELAAIRDGVRFEKTARPGEFYVVTQTRQAGTGASRVVLGADGTTEVTPVPFPLFFSVSPDGRWLVGMNLVWDPLAAVTPFVWDVDHGTGHDLEPWDWRWSPSSDLYRYGYAPDAPGGTLIITSPSDGQTLRRYSFSKAGLGQLFGVYWVDGTPHNLGGAVPWLAEEDVLRPAGSHSAFGLNAEDPRSGEVREVIPAAAGRLTFADGTGSAGLVWARRCLGLFDTVCRYELHQLTAPSLDDRVIAVSDSAAPVALSPAGDRIAIATRDGIFVRDLP